MKSMRIRGNGHVVGKVGQQMETNVMKLFMQIALVMATLAASGCAESKYPVSGETCGPDDPVRTLDANDCMVAPGV
jgi:hypothetical protein